MPGPSQWHSHGEAEIPGNAQMGLAIRIPIRNTDDKPKLLKLPSVLLLLLLFTTPKCIKCIQTRQAENTTFGAWKKKSQVGKQWVGNGKVEWSPPEITQKKVFLALASQPEGSYMFLYIVPRGLKTVRSDAKPISVLWNQGQLYKYLLFLIKPNIATSFI